MSQATHSPKPPPKSSAGRGLFGWLGRQVGHVSKALRQPVGTPKPQNEAPIAPDAQVDAAIDVAEDSKTIYRGRKVVERPMPGRPGVVLRRTVIDEALLEKKQEERR